MSDATHADHGHDEHDHHGTVAAEPDQLNPGLIFGWGMVMLILVILSIGGLTAYFFKAIDSEEETKVYARSQIGNELEALEKIEAEALTGYKKLESGRYQIPIEQAMKAVAKEGL